MKGRRRRRESPRNEGRTTRRRPDKGGIGRRRKYFLCKGNEGGGRPNSGRRGRTDREPRGSLCFTHPCRRIRGKEGGGRGGGASRPPLPDLSPTNQDVGGGGVDKTGVTTAGHGRDLRIYSGVRGEGEGGSWFGREHTSITGVANLGGNEEGEQEEQGGALPRSLGMGEGELGEGRGQGDSSSTEGGGVKQRESPGGRGEQGEGRHRGQRVMIPLREWETERAGTNGVERGGRGGQTTPSREEQSSREREVMRGLEKWDQTSRLLQDLSMDGWRDGLQVSEIVNTLFAGSFGALRRFSHHIEVPPWVRASLEKLSFLGDYHPWNQARGEFRPMALRAGDVLDLDDQLRSWADLMASAHPATNSDQRMFFESWAAHSPWRVWKGPTQPTPGVRNHTERVGQAVVWGEVRNLLLNGESGQGLVAEAIEANLATVRGLQRLGIRAAPGDTVRLSLFTEEGLEVRQLGQRCWTKQPAATARVVTVKVRDRLYDVASTFKDCDFLWSATAPDISGSLGRGAAPPATPRDHRPLSFSQLSPDVDSKNNKDDPLPFVMVSPRGGQNLANSQRDFEETSDHFMARLVEVNTQISVVTNGSAKTPIPLRDSKAALDFKSAAARSTATPTTAQLWTKKQEECPNPTMAFITWLQELMAQVLGPGEYTHVGQPIKGFQGEVLAEAIIMRLAPDTKLARARQELATNSPFSTVKGSLEAKDPVGRLNLLLGFCLAHVGSPLARAQAGTAFHHTVRQPGEDVAAFGQRLLALSRLLGLDPAVCEEMLYSRIANRNVLSPTTAPLRSEFWLAYYAKLEAHGVVPDSTTSVGPIRARGKDSFHLRVMMGQAAYAQVYLDNPEVVAVKKAAVNKAAAVAGASTENGEFLARRVGDESRLCKRCMEKGHVAAKCTLTAEVAAVITPQQPTWCNFCKTNQRLHLPFWCPKNPHEGGDWARRHVLKTGADEAAAKTQKELVAAVLVALAAAQGSKGGRKTQRQLTAGTEVGPSAGESDDSA